MGRAWISFSLNPIQILGFSDDHCHSNAGLRDNLRASFGDQPETVSQRAGPGRRCLRGQGQGDGVSEGRARETVSQRAGPGRRCLRGQSQGDGVSEGRAREKVPLGSLGKDSPARAPDLCLGHRTTASPLSLAKRLEGRTFAVSGHTFQI